MKRPKIHTKPLTDIQRLAQRVEAYRLPSGPFDYLTRAQAMNDAQAFFYEVVREGKRFYADPKAEAVIESARRLYSAALEAAYPAGFWGNTRGCAPATPPGWKPPSLFWKPIPGFKAPATSRSS